MRLWNFLGFARATASESGKATDHLVTPLTTEDRD
jgi:hypothetical protein